MAALTHLLACHPGAPGAPGAPDTPDALSAPDAPGALSAPDAPDAPPSFGRTTPRHGAKELWTLLAGEPETLDPARCSESLCGEVLDNLFAGLVQRDFNDATKLVGDAAQSWQVSPDGCTWHFVLRPSAWSDGVAVTAADFVAGFLRVLAPSTASRSANMLFALRGARAFAEGRGAAADVGVFAQGERTLVVQLDHPLPTFLQLCAHTLLRPVPRHLLAALEARGIDPMRWSRPEYLLSNGAYALRSWRFKRDFVLEKNPHYWDQAQVALQKVHVSIVESADTAVQLYRAGEVDLDTQHLPAAYALALAKTADFRSETGTTTAFYWFNTQKAPLNDVRVRQALSLSVDRAALVRRVLRGAERPCTTLVPDGLAGYRAPPQAGFDPNQARTLLAAAGYGPGQKALPTLRLLYNTAESNRQVAEAIQAMWKTHLGVDASLENQEWRVYLQSVESRDFDVARMGWQADLADADNFLSNVLGMAAGNNLSGWQDPGFEALLQQAGRSQDPCQRLQVLAQAEALAMAAQPLLPLYNGTNTALVKPYLRGFAPSVLGQHLYKHMQLAPQAAAGKGS